MTTAILWPVFALVALIFAVWVQVPFRRVAYIKANPPKREDFATGDAARRYFGPVGLPANNLANLFEARPDLTEAVAWGSGFSAGQAVTVATEDPGADKVAGTLLRLSDHEIVIRRDDPDAGTVAVHFPRLGQILRAA